MLDRAVEGAAAGGGGGWSGGGLHLSWLPYQGRSDLSQGGAPSQETRAGTRPPVMCFTLKVEDTDSLAIT